MTTKKKITLPFLPLRGMVFFPDVSAQIDVGRPKSVAAVDAAMLEGQHIIVAPQMDMEIEQPEREDLCHVGTVCKIVRVVSIGKGLVRVSITGLYRAEILDYRDGDDYVEVDVQEMVEDKEDSKEIQALMRANYKLFEQWVKLEQKIPPEVMVAINVSMDNPSSFINSIISNLTCPLDEQITSLALKTLEERLRHLHGVLTQEIEYLKLEEKMTLKVASHMAKLQKEHFLREQMKAISNELGEGPNEGAVVVNEYRERMEKKTYPEYVVDELDKQLKVLARTPQGSPELSVLQNYIECLLDLPWEESWPECNDVQKTAESLNEGHYGMEKVKERILEQVAIKKLNPNVKAPILCLVGPPGIGKTSIASGIAKSLGRNFVRASLGGVKDEAEIRGHRRTYVGAMPGRIIEALQNAECNNPLFLLDEVDKMASDYRGDPVSALLEVLDPEQNTTFMDRYVGLPFDLSRVMWIITANDLGAIPRPLRDRMEIITLPSYTEVEKIAIGKHFLIKKIRKENGFKANQIIINDDLLPIIIEKYTRESGVRELERQLTKVFRKAAFKLVESGKNSIRVSKRNYKEFLGKEKYIDTKAEKESQVGICNGLAWTEVGGTILPVEVSVVDGKGELKLTGSLGNVMKESGQAALTYIRSRVKELGIDEDFYKQKDIHVHFPEGAIPKDGPSAGITMATAMVSALTGKKVRADVAMTGEITLRGRVLAIGGLKEKVMAAYREGIYTVFIPDENRRDIDDINQEVREKVTFVPVKDMDEILSKVLVD